MKKIYSKFTNSRRKPFQIETCIYQDGDKRRVFKRATSQDSVAHIKRIAEYYENSNSDLLCKSSLVDDQTIEFEFVKGKTLTDILLKAIRDDNRAELEAVIEDYKKLIVDIFGNGENYEAVVNSTVDKANVDLIFDNIIKNQNGYTIIDYEWILNDIEVDFIVYRAVYALVVKYGSSINKLMNIPEFYSMFNLDSENLEKYELKNQWLMDYICGDEESYENILTGYEKKKVDIDRTVVVPDKYVRVYYKGEDNYTDEDSYTIEVNNESQHIAYEISDLEGIEALRIDPLNYSCICDELNIIAVKDSVKYNIEGFVTNGIKLSDDKYLFIEDDPQIIIPEEELVGVTKISIEFLLNTNAEEMLRYARYVVECKEKERVEELEKAERRHILEITQHLEEAEKKHQKILEENENRNANMIHELKLKNLECMRDKEMFKEMGRQLQKRLNETMAENKVMKIKGTQ